MDRAEAGGVVDELHQEAVLPRVAVVDPKPRVYPAATGLESMPRVPASALPTDAIILVRKTACYEDS